MSHSHLLEAMENFGGERGRKILMRAHHKIRLLVEKSRKNCLGHVSMEIYKCTYRHCLSNNWRLLFAQSRIPANGSCQGNWGADFHVLIPILAEDLWPPAIHIKHKPNINSGNSQRTHALLETIHTGKRNNQKCYAA